MSGCTTRKTLGTKADMNKNLEMELGSILLFQLCLTFSVKVQFILHEYEQKVKIHGI